MVATKPPELAARGASMTLQPIRAAVFALLALGSPTLAADKPVKVFVLAGQSNMEGQGFIAADPKWNDGKGSLERLTKDPATADRFKHIVGKDGRWAVRDDVWVHYLDHKGQLTIGYGAKEDRIGTKAFWRDKESSPTSQAYHWNTNAETYYLIGEAMGIAMKNLCQTKPVP